MAEITRLLVLAAQGDTDAQTELYAEVYDELRALARHHLRGEQAIPRLDPPGLVAEAYLRMAGRSDLAFENRSRFFAYASRVMRNVVVDHVREEQALRRGGGAAAITLTTSIASGAPPALDLIAVDRAMHALATLDARAHDVFEMCFFAGMDVEEIGRVRELSAATVKRDLRKARAFLFQELSG